MTEKRAGRKSSARVALVAALAGVALAACGGVEEGAPQEELGSTSDSLEVGTLADTTPPTFVDFPNETVTLLYCIPHTWFRVGDNVGVTSVTASRGGTFCYTSSQTGAPPGQRDCIFGVDAWSEPILVELSSVVTLRDAAGNSASRTLKYMVYPFDCPGGP
jgi:hypothetical protein